MPSTSAAKKADAFPRRTHLRLALSAFLFYLAAVPAFAQRPMDARGGGAEDTQEYQVQLKPPGPERVFQLESEAQLQERWRHEARQRPNPERIEFPKEGGPLTKEGFVPRDFPPLTELVEPNFVCHRRLYFNQPNLERYGWDLGFITPAVSAGKFFWDVALLPYHCATEPCRRYECSAGHCLPGDPVPLLLYPPEISVPGSVWEAGVIVALFAIFPG